jgi:UDP-2,3-diacylglucosamine hydrolase
LQWRRAGLDQRFLTLPEILFISDLHLSAQRPRTVDLFVRFAQERAPEAEAVYILGDLFDAWVGDDDDNAPAPAVREALRALTRRGVAVVFQGGNRDFLIGERFATETGASLLGDEAVIDLYGVSTLLMHGDLLCTDDHDYQAARRLLRSPAFVGDFLAKPLAERLVLAAEYRRRSGEAISLKADDIMDVNEEAVADVLRRHGATRLVHGHTHRPGWHTLLVDDRPAERLVLGEWHEDRGYALSASPDGLAVESFE